MDQKEYLYQELCRIGLKPTESQLKQLICYYDLVLQKNTVMNLTTITEYKEFVKKHFVDSLILLKHVIPQPGMKIIDIGTGAGFPGIPIKIMCPFVSMVLLDSLNKRVLFLQDVIRELGLSDISVIHERAEELVHKEDYREGFDLCLSRAVANLTTLVEYCLPYVKVGGEFISYKSGKIEEELKDAEYAIGVLGGETAESASFCLPDSDIERTLIHIRKKRKTPEKYPRSVGKPAKEPLNPEKMF